MQNNNKQIIVPVVSYLNLDIDKPLIFKENKGRPGIYRINNLVKGKSYVGSSSNLSNRLRAYYSKVILKE
jgi:GIY-YIG catalytic domain-containing protein